MKIVSISDSHNLHREVDVPDGDILIHCGDITMQGELNVLLDFNDWLGELPHSYKIVIAGNHDLSLGQDPMLGYKLLTNCIYLQNSGVTLEGVKFWGSPYTVWNWSQVARMMAFGRQKYDQTNVYNGIPKKLDVLITHSPPKGILDEVIDKRIINFGEAGDQVWGGEHCGDSLLMGRVTKIKPPYHVFGHIHEGYGILKSETGTTFINCSVLDERYKLVNKPVVFEI